MLTANFDKSEFDSGCGSEMPSNVLANVVRLASNLQTLRDYLKSPIRINSAYRSEAWNKKSGGVKNSQHIKGKAADISMGDYAPSQIYEAIELLISKGEITEGGLGLYNTFVHYDIRGEKARWDYRK